MAHYMAISVYNPSKPWGVITCIIIFPSFEGSCDMSCDDSHI